MDPPKELRAKIEAVCPQMKNCQNFLKTSSISWWRFLKFFHSEFFFRHWKKPLCGSRHDDALKEPGGEDKRKDKALIAATRKSYYQKPSTARRQRIDQDT